MSVPTGSKQISSIDENNYNYLTDVNTVVVGWNSAKTSFVGKGKPLNNLDSELVTLEDIELINAELPENQTNYVFSNNNIFTGSNVVSDLRFTENPSNEYTVQVTFLDEGAGYKNSLGYFFYVEDGSNVIILDNADNNSDNSQGYYRPTVIFPNASSIAGGRLRSDGVLLPGHRRTLKGNLANGKFQNVNLGFFLVPNGWDNKDVSTSVGVRYNNKAILHTSSQLNPNHVQGATGSANHGYQSILFNYNSGENYVVGFEDIQRPGGDGDFNDLIFRITTDPNINLANTATVSLQNVNSECLQKTKQGLLFQSPISNFTNLANGNITYRFDRTINFDSSFNRDRYLEIFTGGYLNFSVSTTAVAVGLQQVKVSYSFTNTDINNSNVDGTVQMYLLETDQNRDDETILDGSNPDPNEQTQFDKMVLMQRLENDNVNSEDYSLQEIDTATDPDTETNLKSETNKVPYNTIGSALIWGDPHIRNIRGEIVTLADDIGWKTYFESDQLSIRIDLDFYRDHPIEVYRGYSFIKQVELTDKKNKESLLINTFSPNLTLNKDRDLFNNFKVLEESEIAQNRILRAKYLNLVSFDSEVKCRVVVWKNTFIWVIFYPSRSDFFNEIYIDKRELLNILDSSSQGLIL